MFEICSEFAMISISTPIEIIANSLQISNIELIFKNYSNPAFYSILL